MNNQKSINLKNTNRLVIIVLILLVFFAGYIWWQNKPVVSPMSMTEIRYASVSSIVEAPAHVAYQNGYFAEEGLDLTIEINSAGKTSLEHLIDGQVDIAAVMATPVVYSSFERDDFYIIGKIEHTKIHLAVARKDSGIESAETLKGKRVAVMLGTAAHFFMDSWLIRYGLKNSDLQIFNMSGPDSVKAIIDGSVDAMFYWFPFPVMAEWALEDNALRLPSEDIVPGSWVIVAKKEYVHQNPDTIKGFLRAIVKAENFIRQEPKISREIHAKVSGVDEAIIATIFNRMNFNLSMDQALLLDLEDQARWIISYGYTDKKIVPNYLDYLYPDTLQAVKPEAVTVIKGVIIDDN